MADVVTSSGLDLTVLTRDQRDLIEDLTAHAGGARKAGLPRAARWRADRFQNVREALEDAGWINVQRGIMTLAPVENRVVPPPRLDRISNESDFEEPAMKILEHMATGALGLAEGTYKILNTARAGRRETGGRWSRPDLTLVTVERYKWLRPQHRLRVMTCELKLGTQLDVSAVHEALAHRAQATSAWVMADARCLETDRFERVKREAERHGIGLIVAKRHPDFTLPEEMDKAYDITTYATEIEPHPGTLDEFVDTQLSAEHDWLRAQYTIEQ